MLNHSLARSSAPDRATQNRWPSVALLHILLYVAASVASTASSLSAVLLQWLRIRQRWEKLRDAVFYEFMLLLFQPSPLLLVVMWPGWLLVGALWYYFGGDAAGEIMAA